MSDINVPAGWHPDPANPAETLRWWDGSQWTSEVRPLATFPRTLADPAWYGNQPQGPYPPAAAPGGPPGGFGPGGFAPARGRGRMRPIGDNASFAARNQASIAAIVVSGIYIAIALTSSFFFIGFVPVMMSIRAARQRERLMPLAVLAAAAVVIVTVLRLQHR